MKIGIFFNKTLLARHKICKYPNLVSIIGRSGV